jgi:hypothetical protein
VAKIVPFRIVAFRIVLFGSEYTGFGGFELTPNADGSWSEKTIRIFCCIVNALLMNSDGNLFGSNLADRDGRVFELTSQSDGDWTETVLHNFGSGAGGAGPNGGLIFDSAGNLYGVTAGGGAYGGGTVFEIVR